VLLDALTPEQVALVLAAADEVTGKHQRASRAAELAVERHATKPKPKPARPYICLLIILLVTWNPSPEGPVGRRPSSPARIPT
jgi:hypothetical protein